MHHRPILAPFDVIVVVDALRISSHLFYIVANIQKKKCCIDENLYENISADLCTSKIMHIFHRALFSFRFRLTSFFSTFAREKFVFRSNHFEADSDEAQEILMNTLATGYLYVVKGKRSIRQKEFWQDHCQCLRRCVWQSDIELKIDEIWPKKKNKPIFTCIRHRA